MFAINASHQKCWQLFKILTPQLSVEPQWAKVMRIIYIYIFKLGNSVWDIYMVSVTPSQQWSENIK